MVLQTTTTAAVSEGILGGLPEFRLALGIVLWARVLLQVVWLHPWLGTDFGRAVSRFSVQVGLDGVVEEESILVEVILGLNLGHSDGL